MSTSSTELPLIGLLQRFSVWLTRLTSATHNAYSERLRQAFMKPWFAWVNIIVNRYRSKERSVLYPEVCPIREVQYGVRPKFFFGLSLAYSNHYRAFLGDSCASWSYESSDKRTRGICRGSILRLECRWVCA